MEPMVLPTTHGGEVWRQVKQSDLMPELPKNDADDWLRSLSGELEGHEREVFRALEAAGQFKPGDAVLLAAYVRAAVLERLAVRTFRRSLFSVSSDIAIPGDMFKLYVAAIETLERLAPKLGLCPEARLPKDMRGRPRKPRPAAEPGEPA
jgi:phage terminase small subunit